jgi:hypothetical protein
MKIQIIPLSFDYRKITDAISKAMKTVHRPVVSVQKKSYLEYDDIGFASSWWIDDKAKLEEDYFRKIRQLNYLFLEAKQANFREIKNHMFDFLDQPLYRSTLSTMDDLRLQKHRLIEGFEDRVKRSFDDKTVLDGLEPTNSAVEINHIELKPAVVDIKEDMMVNDGMERFAALICNESNTYFLFYAIGASTIPSSIGQFKLLDERARAPIDEFGWFSAIGTLIRGGAQFPESISPFSIAESAACDAATGGIIAWRTAYTTPVPHTQNVTFPVASHVVYQTPAGANSS